MKKIYLENIYFYLKKQKMLFFWIVVSAFVVAVLEVFSIAALLPVFKSLMGEATQENSSRIFTFIIKIINTIPLQNKLFAALLFLLIITVFKCLLSILNSFLISLFSGSAMYDIKKNLMERISDTNYEFFLDHKQGDMVYQVLVAPEKVALLLRRLPFLTVELLKILCIFALLFSMSVSISLLMIVFGVIFLSLIKITAKKISYSFGVERVEATTKQSVIFNEFINGIKQIMIYNVGERWGHEFDKVNRILKKLHIKDYVWAVTPRQVMEIIAVLTFMIAILLVSNIHRASFISFLPFMGVFAIAVLKLFPSLGYLGRTGMEIAGLFPDLESAYKMSQIDIKKKKDGSEKIDGFKKAIEFKNVYFGYKNKNEILKGINLNIEKPEMTAIVGMSGAGKTTLINLILGLFLPLRGKILVDGVDLKNYKLSNWHKKIGFVSQDIFIFHSTIKDNISFGSDEYSKDDVVRAAKLANADEFIQKFPERYETIVGEKGMKLSGGQQQRIAIARAILRDPEIIILDEATSSLDSISEKAVQEAIKNISQNHTILIIAHRLSTVQNADKIIVLKDGVVVEEGDHQELIKKDKYYSHLYKVLDT